MQIPLEFIIFAFTLLGVALVHHRTLAVALTGLTALLVYKLAFAGFDGIPGFTGLGAHLAHQWIELANLGLLLLGFALLSRHFEQSGLPDLAPDILPDGWLAGLALLGLVFIASGMLDNIAAALVGATVAGHIYKQKVHIGFLAALVAASNAGGAGSVVGDTTTTMMWIAGKSPLEVLHAYIGAAAAFVVFAIPAALMQHKYQPALKHHVGRIKADWGRVAVVALLLIAAIGANVSANIFAPELLHTIPVIGLALWAALLLTSLVRKADWAVLPEAAKGAAFLLSLVLAASLMPVEALPVASWQTALGLGFVSSVFDNIPLTALALQQGGYDWGVLAYAVGFGGSMVWFGSSAGVAVANLFPQAKSAIGWVRAGWAIPIAYLVGFGALLLLWGWQPS